MPCLAAPAAFGQSRQYTPLRDALVEFQNIWHIDLAYDAALVENRWTSWSEPEKQNAIDDLATLLVGTGLVAYRLPSGTYGLRVAEQRLGRISGIVLDATTRQPLADASITLVGTPYGTSTDDLGHFEIDHVKAGDLLLRIGYVGYETERRPLILVPGGDLTVNTRLVPNLIEFRPVEVLSVTQPIAPQLAGLNYLQGHEMEDLIGIGTMDPVRSIRDVAGVSVNEGNASFHIQGGHEGDHQFLLDGSPVYDPTHAFGITGKFSAFALDRVTVHKAGFPASLGSYSSGLVRAEHAFTNEPGTRADVSMDPIALNARVSTQFGATSGIPTSLMVAYRTSVWNGWWSGARSSSVDKLLLDWNQPDIFLHRASLYPMKSIRPDIYDDFIGRLAEVPPPAVPNIRFSDLHVATQLSYRSVLVRASVYSGSNRLLGRHLIARVLEGDDTIPRPDSYEWLNHNSQISATVPLTERSDLVTQVRSSYYRLSHKYAGLDRDDARLITFADRLFIDLTPAEDGNKIREIGVQQTYNLDFDPGSLAVSWEYLSQGHRFVVRDIFPQGILHERTTSTAALFVEQTLRPHRHVDVTAGTRFTYLPARSHIYIEPRFGISTRLPINDRTSFVSHVAGGAYHQFLNQFVVSTISPSTLIPSTRIWLPVDESLPPPLSYHAAADLGLEFLDYWSLRLEGYYKDQPRVFRIDYPRLWQPENGAVADDEVVDLTSQADFVALAKGRAFGISGILQHESPWLEILVRYDQSVAEREYAFRGGEIRMEPVPWSEPHRLHVNAGIRLFSRLNVSARWRGVWGRMWGFRQAYYNYLATDTDQGLTFGAVDFREPTTELHRLDPLKQLDLGVTYEFKTGPLGVQLRADLLNALNRKNQAALFLREIDVPDPDAFGEEAADLAIESQHLIERALTFSLRLRW